MFLKLAKVLEKQIFMLDKLGRFDEAHLATDQFFARHFDAADSSQRARMYAWRFRFRALRGDLLGAVAAYQSVPRRRGPMRGRSRRGSR